MTRRLTALSTTVVAAIATLTSALAFDQPADGPQAAPPAKAEARPDPPKAPAQAGKGATTTVKAEVSKVKVAPAAKAGVRKQAAAEVEAMAPVFAGGFDAGNQMQQLRPVLLAEYHLVRAVCRPDPEQRRQIARDGEHTLREAAKKYVEGMQRPMIVKQRAALEPRHQIRDGLARSIQAHISAEMADRYRAEIGRHEDARKALAVRNLVTRLDRDLVLTRDQREKIETSLTTHWDDSWCQSIEMLANDQLHLPLIPDPYIIPYLNPAQKNVWWGTQKNISFGFGVTMMGGVMVNDPLEDEELRRRPHRGGKGVPRAGEPGSRGDPGREGRDQGPGRAEGRGEGGRGEARGETVTGHRDPPWRRS